MTERRRDETRKIRTPQQIRTYPTTWREIMLSDAFAEGVNDVRAGRPPRFDQMDSWSYERGRQWAVAAPPTMPVTLGRKKLNPEAIAVFRRSNIP
jgi:hypothetical protein